MATITGTSGNNALTGTSAADLLAGLGGQDTLNGGDGNDTLEGGDGNDWLIGGFGNDQLRGGAGVDAAHYEGVAVALTVSLGWGRVHYAGFPANDDTLDSVESIWTGSGNDLIEADLADTEHSEIRAGAGSDTVRGGAEMDTILGEDGADSLFGGAGDDWLSGGNSTDSLDGGEGRDLAIYSDNTTSVRVDLGTAIVSFPGKGWPVERLVSIEGAITGSGNDALIGSSGANDLRGAGGNDGLLGNAGADTLDGGDGRDTLNGGSGTDTACYASHTRGMTIDLAKQTASAAGTTAFTDSLVSIENAIGGQGADRLTGSSAAQSLDGGAGNDTVSAAGGNDTLDGGAGNDTIQGGDGNDSLGAGLGNDAMQGGNGNDILVGARVVHTTLSYDATDNFIVEFYNSLKDDGRDTLDGGAGIDTLKIPSAYYSSFQGGPQALFGSQIDLAAGTLKVLSDVTVDRLVSIENVIATDGNDTVRGNAGANAIDVGNGVNIAYGGDGNDTITGGFYSDDSATYVDRLYGEGGNDRIIGNGSLGNGEDIYSPETDFLSGGTGNDTLVGGQWRTVMEGGTGADRFETSNELRLYGDDTGGPFSTALGTAVEIRDFSRTQGDKILIDIVENMNDAKPRFVGSVSDFAILGDFEYGYARQGADTVIHFASDHEELDEATFQGEIDLVITLDNYAGPIAASDFIFT